MPDGNARRRGDDELPPDPWAGLADPVPPPPPGPGERGWGDPNWEPRQRRHPSRGPGRSDRPPTEEAVEEPRHVPPPRRTVWHHPAVWIALLLLAGVLLLGALLEPRPSPPSEPSPDAVTASAGGASLSAHATG